jgi:hypothetical protein
VTGRGRAIACAGCRGPVRWVPVRSCWECVRCARRFLPQRLVPPSLGGLVARGAVGVTLGAALAVTVAMLLHGCGAGTELARNRTEPERVEPVCEAPPPR